MRICFVKPQYEMEFAKSLNLSDHKHLFYEEQFKI